MTGRAALKGSAAFLALLIYSSAFAQERAFNIEPGQAVKAIPEFARQAGIQIIAPADSLKGVAVPAVKGNYAVRDALKLLLSNTNLEIAADQGDTIILRVAPRVAQPPQRAPAPRPTPPNRAVLPPNVVFEQNDLQEVVITGSRIIRDGYEAPMPLTVLDAVTLDQQRTTSNVADTLNTLPVVFGSMTPTIGVGAPSTAVGGLNSLSLRGLSPRRTLVLLDGKRSVGAQTSGLVDINGVPQQLINRVEVVTGGASAVYGSDAVGGVVNFVLDRQFTGVKGEIVGGLTDRGDDAHYGAALTGGWDFAGGRGHLLVSGETNKKYGVYNGTNGRAWSTSGSGIIANPGYTPNNGQPEYLVRDDVSLSTATHGGIIIAGPLKGTAFGEGGVPYQFNYGPIVSNIYMAGGDWRSTLVRADTISLDPKATRRNAFLRAAYDASDATNVYFQTSWNSSSDTSLSFPAYQPDNGPIILSGNPNIPAAIQTRMTALGLTSFQIGSTNYDRPIIGSQSLRHTHRYLVGATGHFDARGVEWIWDTYAQRGYTRIAFDATGVARKSRFTEAIDTVRDPVTGANVCRSTLANPGNGCSPWNPMGLGVNSAAGLKYILGETGGVAHVNQRVQQDVIAGSLQAAPFNAPAGPVSLALSMEHRRERALSKPDAVALTGDWWAGNYQLLDARYNVTEGAVESVVPLINTAAIGQWDLSAAFRGTSYSTSGFVSSWKVGTTFTPLRAVRFRATQSRDIRAPNLEELYSNANIGLYTGLDLFTNNVTTFVLTRDGNPNLRPERANTSNIGVVIEPPLLPNFAASVDWWNIDLKNAIALPTPSDVIRLCYEGRQYYCAQIVRSNGTITGLTQQTFNLAVQTTRGVDFEGSYRLALADVAGALVGDVSLHASATLYLMNYSNPGFSTPTDDVGQNSNNSSPPNWRLTATAEYALDGFTGALTARAMSSGTISNTYFACASACPASTATRRTIDQNHLAGSLYFDASLKYGFDLGGGAHGEAYLNVRNLMDSDPVLVPKTADQFGYVTPATATSRYDVLGRVFRAGVRFRM